MYTRWWRLTRVQPESSRGIVKCAGQVVRKLCTCMEDVKVVYTVYTQTYIYVYMYIYIYIYSHALRRQFLISLQNANAIVDNFCRQPGWLSHTIYIAKEYARLNILPLQHRFRQIYHNALLFVEFTDMTRGGDPLCQPHPPLVWGHNIRNVTTILSTAIITCIYYWNIGTVLCMCIEWDTN